MAWGLREQPWLRGILAESGGRGRCPFCGEKTLKQSDGDVVEDDRRIEMYCDNENCAAREITILAMRVAESDDRADVEALQTIDAGQDTELDDVMARYELRGSRLARRRPPRR